MDEAKAMAQRQQLMLQQKQQQQQQQQLLLLQQLQHRQKYHEQQQQQQQQQQHQAAAIARFPSNIDAHLRPQLLQRPINPQQSHQNPNSSPKSNPHPSASSSHPVPNSQQHLTSNQQQQQQQKLNRAPVNQAEIQMAYQDAWRVCHPDFKRPFSSLEDACERLLPYHVVADYEAEEDDRILDSDSTGQVLSRSQQWDNNIAAKVAEFTATFEKQVLAFNLISRKRAHGEFRSEERLMIEQALLQEERRALVEVKAEMERQKAGWDTHEANLRMAAMVQAEQAQAGPQDHAEMMSRAPVRASAHGFQRNNILIGDDVSEQEQEQDVNPDEMINGWGNNQRDEKEPSEDFLNDEETDNGEVSMQNEWHGGGELDLNTR